MTTVTHNSPTPSVSVTAASGNNPPQLVATPVSDEQRISFWPQHFGLIPQWVTLEPRVFGWMDRLCEDYCGGIWNLYTLNNGGAFMAPEPDDDDDETWVLFNAMNGNRAEMSPEAAGIAACLMTYSHHACRTECYAMTVIITGCGITPCSIRNAAPLCASSTECREAQCNNFPFCPER